MSAAGSAERENLLRAHLANPFLVLELPPDVGRDQLERQGARLLALLAAGVPGSAAYPTPLGPRERTAEMIRTALAELRDPDRRLIHEWWARGWGRPSPPSPLPSPPHLPGEGGKTEELPVLSRAGGGAPLPDGRGGDGRGDGGEV